MADVVDFPGEYLTPEAREKDRWSTVAFCGVCISGKPRDTQISFLKTLLSKFDDVPDEQPSLNDIDAYRKFAVKFLVQRLIEDSDDAFVRVRAEATGQALIRMLRDGFPENLSDPSPGGEQ